MTSIGPVMLDINSYELTQAEQQLIAHPQVGGVILFSRNFQSAKQVFELTQNIKKINANCLIAVDQEGGRVQRFTKGFSKLPALGLLGELFQRNQQQAMHFSAELGELMALEVQSVGCDLSFAPVLDLGGPVSQVIGDRAFSLDPDQIIPLAAAYIEGMQKAGMAATGKHFPGHGSVEADSHIEIPIDERELKAIKNKDLLVFSDLISNLNAMMPAHVVYSQVDSQPAGFSKIWLQSILRQELGFNGVIFSDDLSMKGAEVAGDFCSRAQQALEAGCDMILVCNNPDAANQVVEYLEQTRVAIDLASQKRLSRLFMSSKPIGLAQLKQTEHWQYLSASLDVFNQQF